MVLYGRTSSLSIGGGVGDARSSGSWARSVHGGAGGLGVNISQASQSLLLGASRGGVGGGFYSGGGSGIGVGLGSGFGASSAAGFGALFKSGAGFGVGLGGGSGFGSGAGFGSSSGFGSGAGFGGGTGFGGGAGLGAAAFKSGAGFGGGAWGASDGILGNEKFTMRILNERLASYLKKVQLLEKANAELELKINQFVESRTSPTARDYTNSLSTITDLQNSINDAFQLKEVVYINLDNATLAADDFRVKYETELALRQTVEADVSELKKLLNDIFMHKTELMLQIETLNEEKSYIKKLHKEEMVATRSKMSGQIHVEVDSAPQQDLISILDDIRDHYEAIATKNRRDLETWFKSKLETLSQEVVSSTQTVETSKNELSVEKTKVQGLELELHSAMAVKSSLAAKLAEAQAFYSTYLSGYQQQVLSLEEQLLQLRADLERQSQDYQTLLDIKTRLELEIAEYRRLLDQGAEGGAVVTSSSSTSQTATQNQAEK